MAGYITTGEIPPAASLTVRSSLVRNSFSTLNELYCKMNPNWRNEITTNGLFEITGKVGKEDVDADLANYLKENMLIFGMEKKPLKTWKGFLPSFKVATEHFYFNVVSERTTSRKQREEEGYIYCNYIE